MFLKSKLNSKTGKKFQEFFKNHTKVRQQILTTVKALGGKSYLHSSFYIDGCVTAIIFDPAPDMKVWAKKPENNAYVPKRNTKKGKEIVLIVANDDWKIPVPDDCTEITCTEYLSLMNL